MATIIRTSDGDILDVLCYGVYGSTAGTVEAVLNANPGLADIEQPYPAELLITFPVLALTQAREVVRLWS